VCQPGGKKNDGFMIFFFCRSARSKKKHYTLARSSDEAEIVIGTEEEKDAQQTVIHALPPGTTKAVEVRLQGHGAETDSLYENV
jgi:hypothetical protein